MTAAQKPALTVDLGTRSYPIYIGEGLVGRLGDLLSQQGVTGPIALVSSDSIRAMYGAAAKASIVDSGYEVISLTIEDDEAHKTLSTVSKLYDQLLDARLDRSTTLIALGGGIVGDITGFVAATYLRGVPFVQVPTTLLSMVDASVGGKTGVNHAAGKNLIGAFHQPKMVVIDPALTRSLSLPMVRSGMAEVLKTALLSDEQFFADLERNLDQLLTLSDLTEIGEIIRRSCEIKAKVVGADETERDPSTRSGRRMLNFGHTFGHAIESASSRWRADPIPHGLAVALGMVGAAYLSESVTGFTMESTARIESVVDRLSPPGIAELSTDDLFHYLRSDKKHADGSLHFILLNSIGDPVIARDISQGQIYEALDRLRGRQG